MGREIKRVPLDFDWPIDKIWHGYTMPDELVRDTCTDCGGTGSTTARRWVQATAHMLLMLDDDLDQQRLGRRMHPYFDNYYTTAYGTRPSPDIRELGTGLAGRESGWLGHDAVDGWRATEKIIAAAGLDPETWGICPACEGCGYSEKYEGQTAAAEAWERTDPPTGDGWQLWETVSEGSPISPVFATATALSSWMQSDAYQWGASTPLTKAQADAFVIAGWAPSMIVDATGVHPGEQVAQ